jgi:YHYH protein
MTRFHCIKTGLAIVTLASLWGCGGGGSSTTGDTTHKTYTTAGVLCSYATSMFNSSYSVNATATVTWSCDSTKRSVTGNGLPDYTLSRTVNGVSVTDSASNIAFPNTDNPNTIKAQTVSQSMTLTPTYTTTLSSAKIPGMALNGVVFDPATNGTCDNTGTNCDLANGNTGSWTVEALGQTSFRFGTDDSNAHVQPQGTYHYHGNPVQLVTKLNPTKSTTGMTLIGWAIDGFPIYAPYGYTTATDTSSQIKTISSSWQLKASPDANRPAITIYPMGAFTQDYEYVAGSGDLDACNGRYGKTPEFPNGIYHYYATNTFPHVQRCIYGSN